MSTDPTAIVNFLRKRDYKLIKELGQGACGRTVLLFDEYINEHFVCKKYTPFSETHRQELYNNFVREIVLLHRVFHPTLVRVFNYYLYPESHSGYILMEYIDGTDIEDALTQMPERVNELFLQAIEGFQYLEANSILHRDIRPLNILVTKDGFLKIIDLGFGKRIVEPSDFDKSISLNPWCDSPNEFAESRYDFRTEVYFIGKLFEKIIRENGIDTFNYAHLLGEMCKRDPSQRIASFFDVNKAIQSNKFSEIDFSVEELKTYRAFSNGLTKHLIKIESGAKLNGDVAIIIKKLEDLYRDSMLEETVPDCRHLLRIFINGSFSFRSAGFQVLTLKSFLDFLRGATMEKRRIVLANIHTKLDAVSRYSEAEDDDVPF